MLLLQLTYIVISKMSLQVIESGAFKGIENTLEELKLVRNSMESIPIQALAILKNLRILDISSNTITEVRNASFYQLDKLEKLYLANNRIKNIEAESLLGVADTMRSLVVDRNPLENVTLPFFENRFRVQISIRYCYNLKPSKPLFSTSQVVTLTLIRLSYNRLTDISNDAFSNINMTTLYLRYNRLTENVVCSKIWASIKGLKKLMLDNNSISLLSIGCFKHLMRSGLLHLYLDFNNISDIANGAFTGLESVERLHLSNNNIKHVGKQMFTGLKRVYSIDLSDNLISMIDRDTFGQLDHLERLLLVNNSLTNITSIGTFMPHFLQNGRLYLNRNPIICECELNPLLPLINSYDKCLLKGTNKTYNIKTFPKLECQNELSSVSINTTSVNVTSFTPILRQKVVAFQFLYSLIPIGVCGLLALAVGAVVIVMRRDSTNTTE